MSKVNEVIGEKNCIDKLVGRKLLVHNCSKKELWKCIGCIISSVAYRNKRHKLWGKTQTYVGNKA